MKIDVIMWFLFCPLVLLECLIRGLIQGLRSGFRGFLLTIGEMLESIKESEGKG